MAKLGFDDVKWSAIPRVPFKASMLERRRAMARATPEAAD
jgi:hypothetical protein